MFRFRGVLFTVSFLTSLFRITVLQHSVRFKSPHVLLKVPNPYFSVFFRCVVSTATQFQILLILVALERCENISKRESKANENSGVPTFARKVSGIGGYCCVVYWQRRGVNVF
jgi:hypothetical protein